MLNVDKSDIKILKEYHKDIVDLMICLEEEWSYQINQRGRTEHQALVISIAEIIGTDAERPEERIKVAASWLRFKTQ